MKALLPLADGPCYDVTSAMATGRFAGPTSKVRATEGARGEPSPKLLAIGIQFSPSPRIQPAGGVGADELHELWIDRPGRVTPLAT